MEKREVTSCVDYPFFDWEWYVCQADEGDASRAKLGARRKIGTKVCPNETTPIPDWCPARGGGVLVVLK